VQPAVRERDQCGGEHCLAPLLRRLPCRRIHICE
jgi:hypothetical protein